MVYKINGIIVFGTGFSVPTSGEVEVLDIFSKEVSKANALIESDKNKNRDSRIENVHDKILRNMEIGRDILALFSEYVYIKNKELNIEGNGIELLSKFFLIECALLAGKLVESAEMISSIEENELITGQFKEDFSAACICADHIK